MVEDKKHLYLCVPFVEPILIAVMWPICSLHSVKLKQNL